jgi:hypothetical protein
LAVDSTNTAGDSGVAVAAGVYVGAGRVGLADAVALGVAVG